MDTCKDYELRVDLNSQITKLSAEVQEFGHIKVSDNSSQLHFRDHKTDQAQIGIPVQKTRNILNTQLQLINTLRVSMQQKYDMNIRSCVILSNGNLLMANYSSKSLIEYSNTGEHLCDIHVSDSPYGIAVIDINCIAVTYAYANFLEIMNNNTFLVEKKITLQESCCGISHDNGRLYVVSGNATIIVLGLSGRQLGTLKIASSNVADVTLSGGRIYYTDFRSAKVYCFLMNGETFLQFESENVRRPRGVAVDNYNNVYVVSSESNNLSIIQHDGKDNQTLLRESDGLAGPSAVYYDKEKRTLLICNRKEMVFLYKVL